MQWFQHDVNATQDAKVKKLIIRHGAVGYAIYFHCLELIASDISETNLTFQLEHDSEIIADNLRIKGTSEKSGIEIVEEIMRTIINLNLFTSSNNRIFCFKLIKRINLSQTSKASFREAITKKKEEFKTRMIENHDSVMTDHDIVTTDHEYQPTNNTNNTNNKECDTFSDDESFADDPTPPPQPRFRKPTLEEVAAYCVERRNGINAQRFIDYQESRGWKIGKAPMKDWKAAVRTWEQNDRERAASSLKVSQRTAFLDLPEAE